MKKADTGKSVLSVIGAIYTLLGGIFVIVGSSLFISLQGTADNFIGLIFTGIGSIFFVLGIGFLVYEYKKKQRAAELLERGNYITAEVVDIIRNHQLRVNGRRPFIVMAKYTDGLGTAHIFKSRNLFTYPDSSIMGQQVKVYVEDDTFKHYYMDIDEILPKVVEH